MAITPEKVSKLVSFIFSSTTIIKITVIRHYTIFIQLPIFSVKKIVVIGKLLWFIDNRHSVLDPILLLRIY